MKNKKYVSNEEGRCPACGSYSLAYSITDFEGGAMFHRWECNDCHKKGEEWYSLHFMGHVAYDTITDEKGNEYWDYEDVNDYISPEEV